MCTGLIARVHRTPPRWRCPFLPQGRLKPKGAAGGACFILSCDCSAGITISGQVASRFTFDHQHPSFCSPHHWWCSYFFLLRNFFFFFSLYKLLFSLLLLLDNSQSLKIWFIILTWRANYVRRWSWVQRGLLNIRIASILTIANLPIGSSAPGFEVDVKAFITLQLLGGSCIIVILLTATFHPGIKRFRTWSSFMLSWIVSCINYSLLTFVGQQSQEFPTHGLCLVQGALVYSIPTLWVIRPQGCDDTMDGGWSRSMIQGLGEQYLGWQFMCAFFFFLRVFFLVFWPKDLTT